MCGITGIISSKPIEKGVIEKMTDKIIHRGPDGYGYHYCDNLAFGHRRLAIIDLSEAGHQPMEYLGRYVITYNGEVYNHVELRSELEKNGYCFNSQTDTEVIMAAYDFWGVECLKRFNGMWAFVIYDIKDKKFFMSRDRFGKKPFYYYKNKNVFIFSSEIKAILEHPEVVIEPNIDFLKKYLKTGAIEHSKQTSFHNIYRFDFSSYFEGSFNLIQTDFKEKKFWEIKPNLNNEKFNEEKAQEYALKYYQILEDAVRIRLRADVKVGSALSGGLDSSSIVYLVNKILKEQGMEELQETFSSVYKNEDVKHCDESEYIDILAKKLNVNSNQIEPEEKNIPEEHKKVIYALENPPESSLMSSWHTFKLVSSTNVKVTLDGQGADEQLAGYFSYISNYLSSSPVFELINEAKYFWPVPNAKKFVIAGLIMRVGKIFFGKQLVTFLFNKIFKKNFCFNLNEILSKDTMSSLITLIHYADHTSMAFSKESRMPFMDYRLVEYLASVPSCYKIHNGWTKYLARLAFNQKLPDEVCWRRDKMGWPIPEDVWFRGNLKNWFIEQIVKSDVKTILFNELNIYKKINSRAIITGLVRFLNVSVWYKQFLIKDNYEE